MSLKQMHATTYKSNKRKKIGVKIEKEMTLQAISRNNLPASLLASK